MPRISSPSRSGAYRRQVNRALVRSLLLATAISGWAHRAQAQIITDGSMGPGGFLGGPNYQIPAELGRKLGPNLFHSFAEFQLYAGESATFSGPASIRNILSRVTGGNASIIDGQLNSTIGGANFFFINPAGTIFGPNAQVNVGGSFIVSSADVVKLADGGSFNALDPSATVLTSAPPQAFGFLSPNPQPITLIGTQLTGAPGKAVTLVGGGINLQDGATLLTPGGSLHLVSVGSQGQVNLSASDPAVPLESQFSQLGNIQVTGGSQIVGLGQNEILLTGQDLVVDGVGSLISAENSAGPKGYIDILLRGDFTLSRGAQVQTISTGQSEGSDINIQANRVQLSGNSLLLSLSDSQAPGGNISLSARQVKINDAQIVSSTQSQGQGGAIAIDADAVTIQGKKAATGLSSRTTGGGRGGNIQILGGEVQLVQAGLDSLTQGNGQGGDIVIEAGTLKVDGQGLATGGINSNVVGVGQGGDIVINADSLQVTNAGTIGSNAAGFSLGGNIRIGANKVGLSGQNLSSIIQTQAFDASQGGSIVIQGGQLRVAGNAYVSTVTQGLGDAGNLKVDADQVQLDGRNVRNAGGQNGLFSQSLSDVGGRAGDIDVTTQDLQMQRGSDISSTTFGTGLGGNITVNAPNINIDGRESLTGIVAGAFQVPGGAPQTGNSGNIVINADSLHIIGQGVVTASTAGGGNGGNIKITAKDIVLDGANSNRATGITSVSQDGATGNAGNIDINAQNLSVTGSIGIGSSTATTGNGGNIIIRAKRIVLDSRGASDNGINSSSLAPVDGGESGRISIESDDLQVLGDASIASVSVSGTKSAALSNPNIDIKSKNILLDGQNSAQSRNIISNTVGLDGNASGGDINIATDHLTMQNGAALTSDTGSSDPATPSTGAGRGGTITIVGLSGEWAKTVDVNGGSFIASRTLGAGEGGSINIKADALTLNGLGKSSEISADTINLNPVQGGKGGAIIIETGALNINQGQISTSSAKTDNSLAGDGGNIDITADNIALDHGFIAATADGEANGGRIDITTKGTGNVSLRDSSITAVAKRRQGGIINLDTQGNVTLVDSTINASARGNGGEATLKIKGNLTLIGSGIETRAGNLVALEPAPDGQISKGGELTIGVGGGVQLKGSGLTSFATGQGGNLKLSGYESGLSRYVILDRSEVLAGSSDVGNGGNIDISSNIYLPSGDSIVNASARVGISGNIAIESPNTNVGGSLILLPTNLLGAENYLAERCVIRNTGASSSFTVAPQNGNPAQPGDLLPSPAPH